MCLHVQNANAKSTFPPNFILKGASLKTKSANGFLESPGLNLL